MRQFILSLLLLACTTVAAAVSPSGTLPVMYITTANQQPVTSREQKLDATLYVTAHGQYPALGSAANPLPITIRGRGNWTWTGFDKKPYKIVFPKGQGQKLLNMPKHRHWALLAEADDYLGFLKNTTGFSLSEHIGLPYTPRRVPVELVLNDEYQGLYFVTETIRIDKDRVNIYEQEDNETNPDLITGGWLVEIDNYETEGNIVLYEHNDYQDRIMVTPQAPEVLSTDQRTYLTAQLNMLNDAIYNPGSQQLEDILDFTDAAKFYLVQEIMTNRESYHGSCYLYKDRDSTANPLTANPLNVIPKWHYGPVWDFGNSYDRMDETFVYFNPPWRPQVWIEQLCQNETFAQRVQQLWYQYRTQKHSKVLDDINTFVSTITQAAKRDAERWQGAQNFRDNSDMLGRKQEFLSRMNARLQWLYSQWGEGDPTPIQTDNESVVTDPLHTAHPSRLLIVNGQLLIERDGRRYNLTGQLVE